MDAVVTNYRNTRDALFASAEFSADSRFVNTDGPVRRVHYLESGSGAPLVLIHGGGSHSTEWYPIIGRLAEKYRLIIVDRPGCGLTDPFDYRGCDLRRHATEFLESFLNALGIQRVILIAHSMGGYFALCFARQFPERTEMLLLPGAPAGVNRWIPPVLRMLGTRGLNKILLRTVARPSVASVTNIYRQLLVKDVTRVAPEYLLHTCYGQMLPGGMESFSTLLETALTWQGWRESLYIGDNLQEISAPLRFVWGDNDRFEHPGSGKAKTASVGDCRFDVVEDAGHCLWMDQPEVTAEHLLRHLAELKK